MASLRRLASLVLLVVLSFAIGVQPAAAAGTFVDDDGNPHEADIEIIAAAGITQGCNPPANDRYCPSQPVTRGQMAAFLARTFQPPAASGDAFADDQGSIFEADINAIAAAGITNGCAPGRFCPEALVTREQMAAFLARALSLPPPESVDRFADDDNSAFEDAIDSLAEAGITTGCAATLFCPTQTVLRDQMASFLARSLALFSGSSRCTLVVGFSQTRDWYMAGTFEQILPNSEWELLFQSGAAIELWADPAYQGWLNPLFSPCPRQPDRLILTISGEGRSVEQWVHDIQAAVATARGKYKSVAEFVLQPVVGGPNNTVCEIGGAEVRASVNHPIIDQAIAQIAATAGDVRAGYSPEVRSCADYGDTLGHLIDAANGPVGAAIASFYLSFD